MNREEAAQARERTRLLTRLCGPDAKHEEKMRAVLDELIRIRTGIREVQLSLPANSPAKVLLADILTGTWQR